MSDARPTTVKPPRRRRRWWFLAAILLVVVLHEPLLRGVGGLLVIDAPHEGGDLLVLRNDPETLAAAAEVFRDGHYDRVLIIPNRPRHTDKLGITPSSLDETRGELAARGVPSAQIDAAAEPIDSGRLRIRAACAFVRNHPGRDTTLVTARFEGRAVRRWVTADLAAADVARMALASRPAPQIGDDRWWTSQPIVQQVFRGYLQWAIAVGGSEPQTDEPTLDWQAFEAAIARGEKP